MQGRISRNRDIPASGKPYEQAIDYRVVTDLEDSIEPLNTSTMDRFRVVSAEASFLSIHFGKEVNERGRIVSATR